MEKKTFKEFISLILDVFFKSTKDTSASKSLNDVDYAKLTRNAMIYGGGASIVYILQAFVGIDFGSYGPIVVPIIAGLLDALRRGLKNNLL